MASTVLPHWRLKMHFDSSGWRHAFRRNMSWYGDYSVQAAHASHPNFQRGQMWQNALCDGCIFRERLSVINEQPWNLIRQIWFQQVKWCGIKERKLRRISNIYISKTCTKWTVSKTILMWRNRPTRGYAASILMLLDNTKLGINAVGFIWTSNQLVTRAATYTIHNQHKRRTSILSEGFESAISAIQRPQYYASDRTVTGNGSIASLAGLYSAHHCWKYTKSRQFVIIAIYVTRLYFYCMCCLYQRHKGTAQHGVW
jgi:hypothetical protein